MCAFTFSIKRAYWKNKVGLVSYHNAVVFPLQVLFSPKGVLKEKNAPLIQVDLPVKDLRLFSIPLVHIIARLPLCENSYN